MRYMGSLRVAQIEKPLAASYNKRKSVCVHFKRGALLYVRLKLLEKGLGEQLETVRRRLRADQKAEEGTRNGYSTS